ncbi:hypothetical protein [Streptomyces sp. NPDC050145]|uniref:hypothetical protein n=1 Tax=Streptomyces sp. NPDC050145 TaxID=3365602 RepID=UPI0037A1BACB
MSGGGWPTAELDPVRRLKVIAAASGRPVYAERRFAFPVERVWAVASDLENELPLLVSGLRSFAVAPAGEGGRAAAGDRFEGRAVSALGHRERFDIVLRPGWCLMQSAVLGSGMAARADGDDGCLFAFYSSLRIPGGQLADRVRAPWSARRAERMLDRLAERVASGSVPPRAE